MSMQKWLQGDGVTVAVCLVMMAAIFLLDIELPIGIVGSMLYIVPVTFAFRVRRLRNLYLIAAIATVLTFVAVVPKTPDEVIFLAFNRPICAGIIWLVVYMGVLRRRGEEARDELVRKLERTTEDLKSSNDELQQFAYVASHDLREPLRMVSGYMALLEKKYAGSLDERGKEYVQFARDGAMRMDSLIVDLLSYSRVGTSPIELKPVDLRQVAERAMINLGPAIEDSQAVVNMLNMPTVAADATQMMQVFQNLIGNAIKYRGDESPVVEVSASERVNEWEIAVKDNGIGIPPEQQPRLFNMFVRLHTREEYEGTGIGLALVRRIVERHGGHIWVESDGTHGSTFRFTISKHMSSAAKGNEGSAGQRND